MLACTFAVLGFASAAPAGEPPNPNDPCSTAGKNTCGTLGVGFYKSYRYGIRWFGDYRGAIPGEAHTFCIDLRYWYPSKAYQWREQAAEATLRNRDGEAVSTEKARRIAYAVWAYGRSGSANQQAAVMLYVHSLMGDARPGEVDPAALNPSVVSLYEKIASDSARYHGPYRIEVGVPDIPSGTSATIRVLSATGNALPSLPLTVTAGGAKSQATTNGSGVAKVALKPATASTSSLVVDTGPIASTLPRIFTPATNPAAANAQRLVVPGSQSVTAAIRRPFSKRQISVSTAAAPTRLLVGEATTDRVTISGALASWDGTVAVRIHGPFRTPAEIRCNLAPAWEGSFKATGSAVYTTPPAKLSRPGWYTYEEVVPGDADHTGLTTRCGVASETFAVEVQPNVTTTISSTSVTTGTAISDRVVVSGLLGEHATVQAALYGPFPSRDILVCSGTPAWTGSIDVAADGEYQTQPFTPTAPGYYTYSESIAAGGFVRATQTRCGETTETALVIGKPKIKTKIKTQQTRPGAAITDTVVISGLGVTAPVQVELWGPFATQAAIRCTGTPYWKGSFEAKGDGTYVTTPVQLDRVGYYSYRESVAGVTTPCADAAETTLARAVPKVTTAVSGEVVRPGSTIFDRILVQGLGKTAAAVEVELFGPFASRAAMRCTGRPYWTGRVTAHGDGVVRSRAVKIAKAGFYTYRERLVGSPLVAEVRTECALAEETSLAAPAIATGRGDVAAHAAAPPATVGPVPTRVRLPAVGIDAPVSPVAIDTTRSVLGVSSNIHRPGWWRDGAAPGAKSGAVLIAGHVDSAVAGAGAFFKLHLAKPGDRVQVSTATGRLFTYRVVSVRAVPKRALPTSVYSRKGPARLVLVTCGGPFDPVARHYRDNIVVTAVPA